ncbi:MAG: hypothetical protein AAF206_32230, partial [Bacteroidota bacterium]
FWQRRPIAYTWHLAHRVIFGNGCGLGRTAGFKVTGVWVGASDRRVHFRSIKYGQGANMSLPIWGLYMQKVYADNDIGLPQDPFQPPKGVKLDLTCEDKVEEGGTGNGKDDPDEFEGDGF